MTQKEDSKPEAMPDVSILTHSGYFQKHFKLCQVNETQEDAFIALEKEYFRICQRNRYTSYKSFRVAKTRWYAVNR